MQIADIGNWEKAMHAYMLSSGKETLEAVEGDWNDEIEGKLKKSLESFVHTHSN